jgi:hypothetical protein
MKSTKARSFNMPTSCTANPTPAPIHLGDAVMYASGYTLACFLHYSTTFCHQLLINAILFEPGNAVDC